MIYKTSTYKVSDGHEIVLHHWEAEKADKIMFLIHGSVEHAARYHDFAIELNRQGFTVIAPDHRGHGLTAQRNNSTFSHLADKDGFLLVVQDLTEILEHIKETMPSLPMAVFGHSLGSFFTRKLISLRGEAFQAAILSGTSYGNPMELKAGIFLSNLWALFTDRNKPNKKFSDFLWGQISSKLKKSRDNLDFINSDREEVEKYREDPLNGNPISIEFGIQMSKALLYVRKKDVFDSTPDNLAILLISGKDDPLANKGRDIKVIASKYKQAGIKKVDFKLYEGARHELINEPNREEIIRDIIQWLKQIFA